MPCIKCSNGKWKIGQRGKCRYKTKASCQAALRAYYAEKNGFIRKQRIEGFNASSGYSNKQYHEILAKYQRQTREVFDKAVQEVLGIIGRELMNLGPDATEQEVVDAITFQLFNNWESSFSGPQREVIERNIEEAYEHFRTTTAQFANLDPDTIPPATFNALDERAIEFFKRHDDLYLGKFITDDDVRNDITRFVRRKFLEEGLPLGGNEQVLSQFKEEFGDTLGGKDWKIRQVTETTVNKMRNYGAVNYMHQAEVTEYEIRGVNDRLQCFYCAALQGKTFAVEQKIRQIEDEVNGDPEQVPEKTPFITSIKPNEGQSVAEKVDEVGTEGLQKRGISSPPFHPFCRDVVVAR